MPAAAAAFKHLKTPPRPPELQMGKYLLLYPIVKKVVLTPEYIALAVAAESGTM